MNSFCPHQRRLGYKMYRAFFESARYTLIAVILAVVLLIVSGRVSAQQMNMMTEMSQPSELAWYNRHFASLEDSVTRYQEAIKRPQVPAERRRNLALYNEELSQYRAAMRQFVEQHSSEDTAARALLISCFREIEVNQDTLRSMASLLAGAGADNTYARYLQQELQGRANSEVGKAFIDFSMPDDQGKLISTKDYRGQYVLINFWASWCGPCRAEMPSFLAVYHRFKDRHFTVIAVSVDTDRNAWLRAKKQDGTDWLNLFDNKAWNSPVVRDYAIHRIPQNMLIGPRGQIVAKNISAAGLIKLLSKAEADSGSL